MSTTAPAYDTVPYQPNSERHRRALSQAIDRLNQGKMNVTVGVTLRASQTSTVVTDSRITPFSFLAWMPLTASAAVAAPSIWASPSVEGTVTLNHASAVAVDQNFRLCILG